MKFYELIDALSTKVRWDHYYNHQLFTPDLSDQIKECKNIQHLQQLIIDNVLETNGSVEKASQWILEYLYPLN